ncbi:1-hydroxycarotenoid 3,4-desaturase CrtD [Roseicyclus mahoneyensis]|uniref:1-hydroxycarotenoid 3,4-desaturase n=1 Tax=Roseicyclus mahoneyensis TaxID=164332 RepID=A0A316GL71_9RHOB|nr:1-hydroxycarotenoid 3,4-desaturase CrtD [Roseicyclus mahoneyensis]PWK61572.1 1-hydroxycarotenoid 3,4-desaturase [Roseicyclus mahoneyensis]
MAFDCQYKLTLVGEIAVTDAPVRAVVIGAGVGGLSAALRLAHAGLAVTVVDMGAGPGGKMRTRDSAAGPIDIGPTVMTLKRIFEKLFVDVGARLSDHVTLIPDEILARHHWRDGSSLDLFHDPEQSAKAVCAFAGPEGERQFRRFSDRAKRLYDAFEGPVMEAARPSLTGLTAHVLKNPGLIPAMAPGRTLAATLAAQFTDPRLRQLFGRYATYVGGSPYRSPAVLSLIWQSEAGGVWRVKGGMNRLAQAMCRLAQDKGAQFRYRAKAARIEQQGDRVIAVHLDDGTRLPADLIVFNGDPKSLVEGHLGHGPAAAVPRKGVADRSLSAFVWGFAAEPAGVKLAHHNVFFCADPKREFDDLAAGRMPADGTLYVCAQDRGGETPTGLERFEIILNGPPGHPSRPEDAYTCKTRTFDALARMGLRFSPTPDITALTMPGDFDLVFPGSDGSLYGLSPHGMMATFQRPTARTRLRGLYLAGGGAHPGAGIPMACLSGSHAAAAILSDLASTSTSRPTATPGGMSTGSAMTGNARSRSSAS